ncbi:MAG TPA: hypothetical protein VIJ46_02745 [Rhabdochlamydiaceae bacterium]
MTYECIRTDQKGLQESQRRREEENNRQWISKYRALFAAALCPSIYSICFIPKNGSEHQLLYAKRGKDLSNARGFVIPNTAMPQEKATEAFVMSDYISISATTWDLNPEVIKVVRTILSCVLIHDETQGVALTFPSQENTISTYLWTKSN